MNPCWTIHLLVFSRPPSWVAFHNFILTAFHQGCAKGFSEQGRWLHIAPTGLRNEGKTVVLDNSAPMVRQCFEMVATGSYSSDHVRKLMTAAGLRTKKGKTLTRTAFSSMLKNKIYCGVIRHAGKEYAANFPALVLLEVWQAVQDALAGRKKAVPKKPTNEQWPLRGFFRCGSCGAKLTSGNVRGRSKVYPKYWCWARVARHL